MVSGEVRFKGKHDRVVVDTVSQQELLLDLPDLRRLLLSEHEWLLDWLRDQLSSGRR